MKVQALFFAQIRETFGKNEMEIELREGVTARELAKDLFEQHGAMALQDLPLLYAVNEIYAEGNTILKDGDRVSFLPPVAGG